MGEEHTTTPDPPGPEAAPDGTSRSSKRKKSGLLAHLPPVPEPKEVHVDGLAPKRAFYGWLIIVIAILVAGVGLNYVMTDGEWIPYEPRIADPEAALGDTPVQFITTDPYDLLTAALFTISIILLGVSLFMRSTPGKRIGIIAALAAAAGALSILSFTGAAFGQHLAAWSPTLAAITQGTGLLVAAGITGALAIILLMLGLHRAGKRHETRALGWLVFAAHWALTGMYYFVTGGGDWVNMIFAYAAVFLLGYFAYQELVSRSLGEDNPSLRFTAAAVVIAAGVWYAFMRVEVLSQVLIETVTVHTVWMLELFNHNVAIGTDGQTGFQSAISYPEAFQKRIVIIILACTAIQSMMIFVAAALATKDQGLGRMKVFQGPQASTGAKALLFLAPSLVVLAFAYWLIAGASVGPLEHIAAAIFVSIPIVALWGVWVSGSPLSLNQRRWLVILVTVPIVYILNLTRNTGIIMMWADRWLERTTPGLVGMYSDLSGAGTSSAAFSIAHNYIGKGGSLIALVVIAFIVFKILPEVLRALVGLLDLPRRRGPLEQHWRALRGHKDEPAPAKAPETAG